MAVNLHALGFHHIVAAQVLAETRQKESVKAASDCIVAPVNVDNADDTTPAALQQKYVDMADDMASVATQFRNRREFDKKGAVADENFDRVLEEDVYPKGKRLATISAVQNVSLDRLMSQARSLFPDDSDLFLVLKELLKRKKLSQIQRNTLTAMLETVTREANPRELRAGINCALKARLFGVSLGLKASRLRQTYRRFLESDRTPLDEYEDWIACYGYQARHIVTDFVQESLVIDIRAEDPSCSLMEFGNLLVYMRKLQILRTADREFIMALLKRKQFSINMDCRSDEERELQKEKSWLLLLFGLIRDDLDPEDLLCEAIAQFHLTTHMARSVWLNAVRAAYKKLPPELFSESLPQPENPEEISPVISALEKMMQKSYSAELQEQRRLLT
jgi:type III secretion system YopN/LcrE/InvE/MxiC family regulator